MTSHSIHGELADATTCREKRKQNSRAGSRWRRGHRGRGVGCSMAGRSAGAKLRAALAAARGAGEVRERVEARRGGGGDVRRRTPTDGGRCRPRNAAVPEGGGGAERVHGADGEPEGARVRVPLRRGRGARRARRAGPRGDDAAGRAGGEELRQREQAAGPAAGRRPIRGAWGADGPSCRTRDGSRAFARRRCWWTSTRGSAPPRSTSPAPSRTWRPRAWPA